MGADRWNVTAGARTSRRALGLAGVRLLSLATPTVAMVACGGGPQQEAKPASGLRKDVTLQVMTGIGAQDKGYFDEVIDVWRARYSDGPKVEWGTPGGNITQKVQALLAADTPPDVVAMNPSQAVGFSDRGLLRPLDPFIRRDKYDLSDFFPLGVTQYEWKGKKYGFPRGMSNQTLFANQTLFDQAGVPYPPTKVEARGWDFDAFLATAERLTRRQGSETVQYGFIVGRGLRGGYGQWVWTNGAGLFDKDFTRCTLDEPRALEGLQFMQDLMYKYRVAPTPDVEQASGGSDAMFIGQGNVGMRIYPAAEITEHRQAAFAWDYAVNPTGKGKRLTTGGGVGWEIVGPTKHPEEAWAVFQHLVSAETIKHMAMVWYPGRKSALEFLSKQDPGLPPKSRHVGADGQKIIHPDPIFPAWDDISREIMGPELDALWKNQKTARQVAESIVAKANAHLASRPNG